MQINKYKFSAACVAGAQRSQRLLQLLQGMRVAAGAADAALQLQQQQQQVLLLLLLLRILVGGLGWGEREGRLRASLEEFVMNDCATAFLFYF